MAYKVWVFWNEFCINVQSCTFRKNKQANEGSGHSVALKTLFSNSHVVLKMQMIQHVSMFSMLQQELICAI